MNCVETSLYIQIGDVCTKLANDSYSLDKLKKWLPFDPIELHKDSNNLFYISDPLPINYRNEGEMATCSRLGDVCFFPKQKRFVVHLVDEELTCGIPRVRIGKIQTELCKLTSLTCTEEITFIWEFKYQNLVS